jgi:fatty acid desaturase
MKTYLGKDISIPNNLNLLIGTFSSLLMLGLLLLASHADSYFLILIYAIIFSYVGNTNFALLHEAAHGVYHSNKNVNYIFGVIFASLFPTGFTFQKTCHLNHHRMNRTDEELFEAYFPGDNKLMKNLQLYGIIGGAYWFTVVAGWMAYLTIPLVLKNNILRNRDDQKILHTSADSYLRIFDNHRHAGRIRFELLYTIAFHAILFAFFGMKFLPWLFLYFVFGLNWGALQYADHAYSPRDIRNGAWNLKVNKLIQMIFLNYHHHLAHHQHPHVPWIHLPKFVDFSIPRKTWFEVYIKLWGGVTPVQTPAPEKIDDDFEKLIYEGTYEEFEAKGNAQV